jgi:predicted Holliday junction resolvase-like endonuclease
MDLTPTVIWNIILSLVIAPIVWVFKSLFSDIRRLDQRLQQTREEYATRAELREDMRRVMESLNRLEDKLDKILEKR